MAPKIRPPTDARASPIPIAAKSCHSKIQCPPYSSTAMYKKQPANITSATTVATARNFCIRLSPALRQILMASLQTMHSATAHIAITAKHMIQNATAIISACYAFWLWIPPPWKEMTTNATSTSCPGLQCPESRKASFSPSMGFHSAHHAPTAHFAATLFP